MTRIDILPTIDYPSDNPSDRPAPKILKKFFASIAPPETITIAPIITIGRDAKRSENSEEKPCDRLGAALYIARPGSAMRICMRAPLCLLTLLILLCIAKTGGAQERMRIAWAGSTPSNTPIWVADQKGFFKKNGLNAEVIAISASTIVIQALLTGEVDFIIAPSATLVTSRLAGADTVMVSTNLPLFIDHIVSLGNISTRGAAQRQDRRRKPFGNNIGHDSPSRSAPLGRRSGEGNQDHRHRREPAATRRSGQQSHPVHAPRRAAGERSGENRLSRSCMISAR